MRFIGAGISQRGTALLELALAAPLFFTVIYGMLSVASLARSRYQMAVITHGVMREAAGGLTEGFALSERARWYASSAGMGRQAAVVVEVKPVGLSIGNISGPENPRLRAFLSGAFAGFYLGSQSGAQIAGALGGRMGRAVRVTVRGIFPVGGLFRHIWPGGVPLTETFVCLPGAWQSPAVLLRELVPLPAVP